uniref:Retinitis pigmentosa GTPase regulator a n=1 Tax=Nothobranchius pienaari TaxID=704102 RepID=A0A1A8QAZ6_9TELE
MFLPNFERSSVQSGQEGVDDGPGEANSDSGDSLFITQKDVPEAVRSGRRRHTNLRSDSKLQQYEDFAELVPDSSSSSDEEPKTARKGNNNCYKVPKFKFSFLNEDYKTKPVINNVKNAKFQTCAMASFIISVRELWRSFELGGDLAASLPTIDTDGEVLSSMSEGGEETSESEDIKVVERKCFVTPLRKTRSQSWNSSDKRSSENKIQKKALKDSQKEEAKGTDRRSKNMLSKEFLSSATESSDDETVVSRKNEASAADIFAQIGRPTEESLTTNSSHATACEPSPEKHIRRDQEVRIAPTEPNCEDFHTDRQSKSERAECGLENQNPSSIDIHNDTLCRKSRVKKRKKKKDREDEEHNQKETDDQHYLVDITKEEHLSQQVDTPVLKWKEKKKTKDTTPEEEEVRHRQSEEEVEDDSVEDSKWTVSKKTKRRNFVEGNIAAETSGVGSTKKKKKKHLDPDVPQTSPGHHEETGKHLENTEVSLETTESRSTKRKKKKEPTSNDDPLIAGDDDDAVTMETGLNLTVTKISISATEDISHKADNSQKKKERAELKKKKMRGSSSAVICEETVAPGGDSVLVQINKEKTSSFLAADEEEKSRKKHKQQHGPSPSAAPPDVVTEALTATSADATEGYSESKDGGKRRRGLLLQSVWKEKQNLRNWRMHLKKKKRKRNNIEAMSSTEKVESLADVEISQTEEAVVKKRKKDAEETRETG